jgi:hypothetical protein
VHLTVYTIPYCLNFSEDVLTLTSYTPFDAQTLNYDHKMDILNFI